MSFFDWISDKLKSGFQGRQEEQRITDSINREAHRERLIVFEEELRKRSFQAAHLKAKQDAMNASGLKKLQAINRVDRLENVDSRTVMGKFAEYTRRNLARRDANIKRTKLLRDEAAKMVKERQQKKIQGRVS